MKVLVIAQPEGDVKYVEISEFTHIVSQINFYCSEILDQIWIFP